MLYSLRGILVHYEQNFVVVECAGVGYKCITSLMSLRDMPQVGKEVTLYTHLSVREDSIDLFGFTTSKELNCFKILTGVSGVGAKVGIAILSEFTPEQVALCIASSDSKTLTKASGVGTKLAQRIILELKDKMKSLNVQNVSVNSSVSSTAALVSGNIKNAIDALAVLGYNSSDVAPILAGFDENLKVEELIRLTLMELGKK